MLAQKLIDLYFSLFSLILEGRMGHAAAASAAQVRRLPELVGLVAATACPLRASMHVGPGLRWASLLLAVGCWLLGAGDDMPLLGSTT